MECKLLNEYNGIAVGDIVRVIEKHQFYTEHAKAWLNYYGLNKDKFLGGASVIADDIVQNSIEGRVLAIGKHLDDGSFLENDMLFYIDFGKEKLVFSIDGLELVSKATKNYYTIINKVKHFYIIE